MFSDFYYVIMFISDQNKFLLQISWSLAEIQRWMIFMDFVY